MRGRTNITQRTLPYVNGDVMTAEVDSGNTIAIGDFVEYKTVSAVSDAGFDWDNDKVYLSQLKYGSNYVLGLRSSILDIWDKRSGQLVYSLIFNENVNSFTVLSNGDIIVASVVSTSTGVGHLYYISFENNTLIIKDTKTINKSSDISSDFANVINIFMSLVELDSTHIGLFVTGHRVDQYVNVNKSFISVVVIDGTNKTFGSISVAQEIDLTVPNKSYSYINEVLCAVKISGQNKIIFGYTADSSSSATASSHDVYVASCYLTYNSSYVFTIQSKLYSGMFSLATSTSYKGFVKAARISDDTFAFIARNNSSSSSAVSTGIGVCKYYSDNDNISVEWTDVNTFDTTYVCSGSEDNVIYISSRITSQSHYQRIFRIEFLSNNTFKKTNLDVLMGSGTNAGQFSVIFTYNSNDRIVSYTLVSGSNKMVTLQYNQSDNILTTGIDKTYVKSYNGGRAIGFAKTAGSAGSNIKFYVPHNS